MGFMDLLPLGSSTHNDTEERKAFPLKLFKSLDTSPQKSLRTRKRTRAQTPSDEVVSPTYTKKRVTTRPAGLVSPDVTPIKQSSQISVVSGIASASKKLNFVIKEETSAETSLPTPDTTPQSTPQKGNRVVDLIKQEQTPPQTPVKTSLTPEDKENFTYTLTKPRNIYTKGKALFLRSTEQSFTTTLPEREAEAGALHQFLVNHITSAQGTSLYISGPPGTGKTAQCKLTLSQFLDTEKPYGGVQSVDIDGQDYRVGYTYINCMSLGKTETVFSELLRGLTGQRAHLKECRGKLMDFLSGPNADMSVVILDELDQLLQSRNDEVFTLFSWAVTCKITLIGISNALDMVDRFLPRLKMNGLSPNTLNFLPYTSEQIAKIITAKLRLLNENPQDTTVPLFHPAAISLCSKKAASHTGDLRKAFDVCRAAIEIVERNWKKAANNTDDTDLPTVKIQHIARIANQAFNGSPVSKLRDLNLSQKYLLCMLTRCEESSKQGMTVNAFYEYYMSRSSKDKQMVGILKKPEFLEVLSSLEANSSVRVFQGRQAFGETKVSSGVVKADLMDVIKGVYVLEKLME
ncbi:Cell division control protein 18 [Cyberlindnera fabianii]|nr:Cell division control protein 18 [Cyberlindnera fabianii]